MLQGTLAPSNRHLLCTMSALPSHTFRPPSTICAASSERRVQYHNDHEQAEGNGSTATRHVDVKAAAAKFGWDLEQRPDFSSEPNVRQLPVAAIRRPLAGIRSNSQEKVDALKSSIQEVGLLEPIDVLEVDGQFWGFSGCHRYQAHQELGKETILCRVRKANRQALRFHMM